MLIFCVSFHVPPKRVYILSLIQPEDDINSDFFFFNIEYFIQSKPMYTFKIKVKTNNVGIY